MQQTNDAESSNAADENDMYEKRMNEVFALARKVRKRLKEKNRRQGHIKCPFCEDSRVDAALHPGRRGALDSLHMKCRTSGCVVYME